MRKNLKQKIADKKSYKESKRWLRRFDKIAIRAAKRLADEIDKDILAMFAKENNNA